MSGINVLAPIEVVAFSNHRPRLEPARPAVAAAAAWGAPSSFDFSVEPDGTLGPDLTGLEGKFAGARPVDKSQLIRGVERFREVTVETVQAGDTLIDVEGIRSVTFFLGVREVVHEERSVRGSYTSIQPTIEHVSEYLRFNFPFTTALERGVRPPPDSPDLPDLDARYGG